MDQIPLFGERQSEIVNVAKVPQRSPFRYPGGKTWLIPHIRRWLCNRADRFTELIEPFAGGGIVSLTAAFEDLVDHVTMVEMDDQVASVWTTILEGKGELLAEEIANFDLSLESVNRVLKSPGGSQYDKAFATLLSNRVKRGGILAPGASLIKAGENGKGISSRWYPETLKRRIMDIIQIRDRITFIEGDGMEVLRTNSHRSNVAFFIDPPYTVAAKRLYKYWDIDHEELFRIASNLSGEFLMTYDNDERISSLASDHGLKLQEVPMKNTHHAKMKELLVSRDFSWI